MNVETLIKDFFAAGQAAIATSDGGALHQFRIAAKRLRYTLELLDAMYGPALQKRIEKLRGVQQNLGDMHDAMVAARYLRELPRLSSAAKPLPAKLERDGARHIEAFRRHWQEEFGKPGEEERWIRYLESPRRRSGG